MSVPNQARGNVVGRGGARSHISRKGKVIGETSHVGGCLLVDAVEPERKRRGQGSAAGEQVEGKKQEGRVRRVITGTPARVSLVEKELDFGNQQRSGPLEL
jgi:hypothetical protein